MRRGLVFGNCSALATLAAIGTANPVLGTLSALLNAPTTAEVCGTGAGAKAAKAAVARVRAHSAEIAKIKPAGLAATPPAGSTTSAGTTSATAPVTSTTADAPTQAAGGRCRSRPPASAASS